MRGRTIISFAALLAPTALAAQDSSTAGDTLRVFAGAPAACVVTAQGPTATGAVNAVFTPDGTGGGSIEITQLVDPQTAEPRASDIELTLPVICNAAHRLVVTSGDGGLLRAGGRANNVLSPNAFADLLPYSIAVDWGGASLAGRSNAAASLATQQPARNGALRLRIATDQGGGALVAGRYSDNITIRFEPAS